MDYRSSAPAQFPEYAISSIYDAEDGIAHSPSIIEHGDGSIQAIWFMGEEEAAPETGLMTARFENGKWSDPQILLTARSDSLERGVYINTIGNPLLARASNGDTWLFYVSPSLGGWATSRISFRASTDHGHSWGPASTLHTSPMFNISTLVKQPSVCLEGGNIALPLHFEMIGYYPKLAVLSQTGEVVDVRFMFDRIAHGLQPMVMPPAGDTVEAFLRPADEMSHNVYQSDSSDGGLTWSDPTPTSLPNPGAPVCGIQLENGGTLMAFNDHPDSRSNFRLAYRSAPEADWQRIRHQFSIGGDQRPYAYCTLITDRQDRIHLIYSNKKEASIYHAHFSQDWVASHLER